MTPEFINPGFLDPGKGTFRVNPTLDQKLKSLLADLKANRPPFDKEPYKGFVGSDGNISVALVDLSTDAKLLSPQLAEFKSTVETVAASLAKISVLYAAHQLRFDLNIEAKQTPLKMNPGRVAQLRTIFDATQVGGASPVFEFDFNLKLREKLTNICDNCNASFVIAKLGIPYVSSVLRQSGLYDCRLGGLWIGSIYAGKEEIKEECRDDARILAQVSGQRDPISRLSFGATALSAAAFFTLLAQGRLVDDAACQSMKDMLVRQKDILCESRFQTGLTAAGLAVNSDKVFSKIGVLLSKAFCAKHQACCGLLSKGCKCPCFIHEAALIERVHGTKRLRYVAAVLTESIPGARANDLLQDIIVRLDELIRDNP